MKKKKKLCFLIAALMATAPMPARALEEGKPLFGNAIKEGLNYTFGLPNGRYWDDLKLSEKISFLEGLHAGTLFMATELAHDTPDLADTERIRAHLYDARGFSDNDYAVEIDLFYQDSRNLNIPAAYALDYAYKKMAGSHPDQLDAYKDKLHRIWDDPDLIHAPLP